MLLYQARFRAAWLCRTSAPIRGVSAASRHQQESDAGVAEKVTLADNLYELDWLCTDRRLRAVPELFERNQRSLVDLRSWVRAVVEAMSTSTPLPPGQKRLQFMLPIDPNGKLERVVCDLRSDGSLHHTTALTDQTLKHLFYKAGLSPTFSWDGNYPLEAPAVTVEQAQRQEDDLRAEAAKIIKRKQDADAAAAEESTSAAEASTDGPQPLPSVEEDAGVSPEELQLEENLSQLANHLRLISFYPWVRHLEYEGMSTLVEVSLLDGIEAMGVDLRGAVHRLWGGHRDVPSLLAGKDAEAQTLIMQMLHYTRQYDRALGPPREASQVTFKDIERASLVPVQPAVSAADAAHPTTPE